MVFSNIHGAFRVVLEAMENMNIPFENEANKVGGRVCACRPQLTSADDDLQQYTNLMSVDREIAQSEVLPMEYLDPFKSLWADGGVQKAIAKGNEYALHDNLD